MRKFGKLLIFILVLFCIPSIGMLKVEAAWEKSDGLCYNDKGEVIEGAILKGVDVSSWDETVNWTKLKNGGIDFAFVRAGHGDEKLDKQFRRNMEQANQNGIPVGVYFYSMAATVERSLVDADFVLNQIQGYEVGYPVVVDMESDNQLGLSTKQRTDIAIAFCERIKEAGYYPMVYCNEWWYTELLDTSRLKSYDKWIARYASTYNKSIPRTIWQCTNTAKVDGIPVDECDIDFAFVDYTKIITPRKSAIPGTISGYRYDTPDPGPHWIRDAKGWWYYDEKDTYPKNCWRKIDGTWYSFNASGYMRTGWYLEGKAWYYLDGSGAMRTGFVQVGNKKYYLNADGIMVTGWLRQGNEWYYLNSQGDMQTGWKWIGDAWYYLKNDGKMAKGWLYEGGNWYYLKDSGAMSTGWQKAGSTWYYLNSSGSMAVGWLKIGDTWYYLKTSGAMAVDWINLGGIWYYFYGSGAMAHDTWVGPYYLESSGAWKTT